MLASHRAGLARLDEGCFEAFDMLVEHRLAEWAGQGADSTDGVLTGWGTINCRKLSVFAKHFMLAQQRLCAACRRELSLEP